MVMFLLALNAPSHIILVPAPRLGRVGSLAPTSLLQSSLLLQSYLLLLSLLHHTLQLHLYLQLQLYLQLRHRVEITYFRSFIGSGERRRRRPGRWNSSL